jgi:hypothetical protein
VKEPLDPARYAVGADRRPLVALELLRPAAARTEGDPVGPPSPLDRTRALRAEALRACDAAAWERCLEQLDEAAKLDAAGDRAREVAEARERARKALDELRDPKSPSPAPAPTGLPLQKSDEQKSDEKSAPGPRATSAPAPSAVKPPPMKPTSTSKESRPVRKSKALSKSGPWSEPSLLK